jgi:single-stranded DNA-binding protein
VMVNPSTSKVEFEILDRRSVKVSGQWENVFESATFVAWNEDAERIAEMFTSGREVWAIGRQETSRYEVEGVKKRRITYRVVDWGIVRRKEEGAGEQRGGQGQAAEGTRPRQQPAAAPKQRFARQPGGEDRKPPQGGERRASEPRDRSDEESGGYPGTPGEPGFL